MPRMILGAALGTCVHVGGLHHFLRLAEAEGYRTESLGPAVSIDRLMERIDQVRPELVAISYRLTPENAAQLFEDLRARLRGRPRGAIRFVFGGTPPVAEVARRVGLFEKAFSGQEPIAELRAYLRGGDSGGVHEQIAHDLVGRIAQKYPYPLLRHHFGRPSVEETLRGIEEISEAGILDVLSLGTDQNAQEFFFEPEKMDPTQHGAGGVPVRSEDDLRALYRASRRGNYPLMRCYAGTKDLLRWAAMSLETIHNAWAAIPLTWYSVMDGRSQVPLREAIAEKQATMRWYAQRGIPVEVNESHQWSLRDSHDALAVTTAFLAAYNAKAMGVQRYVAQYMFNTPPGTSPEMDLAKMGAKIELIEGLHDQGFTSYREVRAGIAHFSSIPAVAQGQLAASAVISLGIRPHILHVVGFSEGDHASFPGEVIHSCNIIHGVLQNCLGGLPDMLGTSSVQQRKRQLLEEARTLLDALRAFGKDRAEDPWTDPSTLAAAITEGLLDAPHFRGNRHLCGEITTRLINGAWWAIDERGEPMTEEARIRAFHSRARRR
jgi:hypothetical protein